MRTLRQRDDRRHLLDIGGGEIVRDIGGQHLARRMNDHLGAREMVQHRPRAMIDQHPVHVRQGRCRTRPGNLRYRPAVGAKGPRGSTTDKAAADNNRAAPGDIRGRIAIA